MNSQKYLDIPLKIFKDRVLTGSLYFKKMIYNYYQYSLEPYLGNIKLYQFLFKNKN